MNVRKKFRAVPGKQWLEQQSFACENSDTYSADSNRYPITVLISLAQVDVVPQLAFHDSLTLHVEISIHKSVDLIAMRGTASPLTFVHVN